MIDATEKQIKSYTASIFWAVILFVICFFVSDASAYELPEVVVVGHAHGGSGGAIFDTLAEKTGGFAQKFRRLAMVMGAFGIVMFTFMAICGKINFKHLGYIVICLFFVAGTASLISYIAEDPELPTSFDAGTDTYQRASSI